MRELLENQTIRVDAHRWGNREHITWDNTANDIHIDKTTYWRIRGKRVKVRIRIPINSNRPFVVEILNDIRNPDRATQEAKQQLEREIARALADPLTRQSFIDDLIDILENYQSILSSSDRARDAVRRLGRHFGLNDNIIEDLVSYSGNRVRSFVTLFATPQENFYIQLNTNGFEAGQVPDGNVNFNSDGIVNPNVI